MLSERKDQERERTKRMSKYHALAERDIERLAKDWITQNPHQALRLSVDACKIAPGAISSSSHPGPKALAVMPLRMPLKCHWS